MPSDGTTRRKQSDFATDIDIELSRVLFAPSASLRSKNARAIRLISLVTRQVASKANTKTRGTACVTGACEGLKLRARSVHPRPCARTENRYARRRASTDGGAFFTQTVVRRPYLVKTRRVLAACVSVREKKFIESFLGTADVRRRVYSETDLKNLSAALELGTSPRRTFVRVKTTVITRSLRRCCRA